jgi:hypothetical protein
MFLARIVYASRKLSEVSPADLQQILETAHANNRRNGVTGMLCFNRKYFMQILEGGRTAVNETYNRVVRDHRHSDVVLLDYSPIDCRDFGSWAMGYVSEAGLTEDLLLKFGRKSEFSPLDMTPQGAVQLLVELRDNLRLA